VDVNTFAARFLEKVTRSAQKGKTNERRS